MAKPGRAEGKSVFHRVKVILKYICFAGLIIFGLMSIIGTGLSGGSGSLSSGGIGGSGK